MYRNVIDGGIIEYTIINDGDHFELRQLDADEDVTDVILMTREVALEVARCIMENLGEVS